MRLGSPFVIRKLRRPALEQYVGDHAAGQSHVARGPKRAKDGGTSSRRMRMAPEITPTEQDIGDPELVAGMSAASSRRV